VSAERRGAANETGGTRTRGRGQSESGFSIWPAVGTAGGTAAAARRTVEIDWAQRTEAAAVVRKTRTERAAAKARWAAGKMTGRRTWGEGMRGAEMTAGLVVEAAATETSVGRRRTDAAAAEMIGERTEEEGEEGATISRSPVIVVAGRTGRAG
jgi:hypothetical protein